MKLKYYIRGIGIGVIITTFVFMIVNIAGGFSNDKKLTSETETKATSSVLAYATTSQAENNTKSEEATTIEVVETTESTSKDKEDSQETTTDDNNDKETKKEENETVQEETTTQETTTARNYENKAEDGDAIEVEIRNIKYVSEVSDILYDKGIISDVSEFNSFMTFSGNDLKVQEGRYKLKPGDTFENIASIITRSEEK